MEGETHPEESRGPAHALPEAQSQTHILSSTEFSAGPKASPLPPSRQRSRSRIEIGRLLADRFVITRRLGTGGMGAVYEAEDRTLGGAVALKVIRAIHQAPNSEKRLLREVQLARQVPIETSAEYSI